MKADTKTSVPRKIRPLAISCHICIFFLTLVCQVLFFLGDARARERARSAAAAPPPPAALLLLAVGLESWPDARLALAGSSCLPILA